jgi:phosphatidylserine/phosphatidylglycerophosphate/cardiolipin synthase-like enzyme
VLDDESYEGALSGPGVVLEDRSSRMHNKFCIIDGTHVWTGSFNPTYNDNDVNDNSAIYIDSVFLSKNYEEEFSELWREEFSGGKSVDHPLFYHNEMLIENAFCPEDACEQKVADALSKAEESVYIMVFSFTSEKIGDAILFNDGIEVKGVFDSSQAGSKYSQFHRLLGFGIPVKKDRLKGKLHHKVFIVDNETVVMGSYNPTGSGSSSNDENVLIIHDPGIARMYSEEFFRLYGAS